MKIAVCGSNPATKMLAPFGDPEWKIWACSPHNFSHGRLPRVDEWFELHKPARHRTRPDDYLAWVRDEVSREIPVWVRDTEFFPPCGVKWVEKYDHETRECGNLISAYPEKLLQARYGPFFFTSSIAYMLAKAIDAKPIAVGIFGVMQASLNEFSYQRPGIQFFLNEAHRAGIEVIFPPEQRLTDIEVREW